MPYLPMQRRRHFFDLIFISSPCRADNARGGYGKLFACLPAAHIGEMKQLNYNDGSSTFISPDIDIDRDNLSPLPIDEELGLKKMTRNEGHLFFRASSDDMAVEYA